MQSPAALPQAAHLEWLEKYFFRLLIIDTRPHLTTLTQEQEDKRLDTGAAAWLLPHGSDGKISACFFLLRHIASFSSGGMTAPTTQAGTPKVRMKALVGSPTSACFGTRQGWFRKRKKMDVAAPGIGIWWWACLWQGGHFPPRDPPPLLFIPVTRGLTSHNDASYPACLTFEREVRARPGQARKSPNLEPSFAPESMLFF